jgi:hypothetical protein
MWYNIHIHLHKTRSPVSPPTQGGGCRYTYTYTEGMKIPRIFFQREKKLGKSNAMDSNNNNYNITCSSEAIKQPKCWTLLINEPQPVSSSKHIVAGVGNTTATVVTSPGLRAPLSRWKHPDHLLHYSRDHKESRSLAQTQENSRSVA